MNATDVLARPAALSLQPHAGCGAMPAEDRPLRRARWLGPRHAGPRWAAAAVAGACFLAGIASLRAAPAAGRLSGDLSLRNEMERTIDRGVEWLAKNQHPDGWWSTPDHPAITGLALVALQGDPSGRFRGLTNEVSRRGYDFLLGCAKPDGGIYRKEQLLNYNTAISLLALLAANESRFHPLILKARQFLVTQQNDFGEKGVIDDPLDGGIGYGGSTPHADLANTLQALEALYHSRRLVEDANLAGAKDLNWQAVIQFIQNCQNLPSHNPQKWVADDPQNLGGFVYYPGASRAGETNYPSGRVALRSYGSISYAGLLSYIYADLKREDARVQAVFDWLRRNYTLEENPGMGPQGLFYYFHTMAKALTTYGVERLELADGRQIDWRQELALKLANLQRPDGSWVNANARWWENDPALVTAYALIALELIHRQL